MNLELIYNILPETGPITYDNLKIPERKKKSLEKSLREISDNVSLTTENIGAGSDWIIVIAHLAGLFFLGDKINKNLDAWKALSNKFVSVFKKTKPSFIDSNGARLIAVEKIMKNEDNLISVEEVLFHEINLNDLTNSFGDNRKPFELRSKPLCYYSIIFKVNQESYYFFGIKSNGQLKTIDKIDDTHLGFLNEYTLEK